MWLDNRVTNGYSFEFIGYSIGGGEGGIIIVPNPNLTLNSSNSSSSWLIISFIQNFKKLVDTISE